MDDDIYCQFAGLVEDILDRGAKVSAAHHIVLEHCEPLKAHLRDQGLNRFQTLLDERGLKSDSRYGVEWFAEHARAQLAPEDHCSSKPQWLAWTGLARDLQRGESAPPRGAGENLMALWAQDARAARRGLQALQLQRTRTAAHLLLARSLLPQLERVAYERNDLELIVRELPPRDVWALLPAALQPAVAPPKPYECWASLVVQSGEALERMRVARVLQAQADDEAAREKLGLISARLLDLDPKATMEVSACDGQPGRYAIDTITFNGHIVSWGGEVDRHSDVEDIVRVASASCSCC